MQYAILLADIERTHVTLTLKGGIFCGQAEEYFVTSQESYPNAFRRLKKKNEQTGRRVRALLEVTHGVPGIRYASMRGNRFSIELDQGVVEGEDRLIVESAAQVICAVLLSCAFPTLEYRE